MDKIQDESENDSEKSSGSDYSANLPYSTSYSYSCYNWAVRVLHFSAFIPFCPLMHTCIYDIIITTNVVMLLGT